MFEGDVVYCAVQWLYVVLVGCELVISDLWWLLLVMVDFIGCILFEVVLRGKYLFMCVDGVVLLILYSYLWMEGLWYVYVIG